MSANSRGEFGMAANEEFFSSNEIKSWSLCVISPVSFYEMVLTGQLPNNASSTP